MHNSVHANGSGISILIDVDWRKKDSNSLVTLICDVECQKLEESEDMSQVGL